MLAWLNRVPLDVPGLPSLTVATIIWIGLSVVALGGFGRFALRALRQWWLAAGQPDAEPERLLALGDLIRWLDGVVILLATTGIGFAAASLPRVHGAVGGPNAAVMGRMAAIILLFLLLPAVKVAQAIVSERVYRAARAALRARLEERDA